MFEEKWGKSEVEMVKKKEKKDYEKSNPRFFIILSQT